MSALAAPGASAASTTKLVSADSHVCEPPDLWTRALGEKYGARVPHVGKNAGSGAYGDWTGRLQGDWFVVEGIPAFPMALGNLGGIRGEERKRLLQDFDFWRDARKSAYEPAARLTDMDIDGVSAEVIYPSYMARMLFMRDAELQRACAAVYNDWVAEFCEAAPGRLIPAAAISLVDAHAGAAELERCAKRGHKGAAIWCVPPPELSFASSHYDPFWKAAEATGVPIALHALPPLDTAYASPRPKAAFVENRAMGLIEDFHLANILFNHHIQRSLAQLVLSGVFERFPKLKLVVCEWGTEWIPGFYDSVDWTYSERPEALTLTRKPSEYLLDQVWYTFDRPLGLAPEKLELLGNRLLWSSDFPHIESSWPASRQMFSEIAATTPTALHAKLAAGTCAELYGSPAP